MAALPFTLRQLEVFASLADTRSFRQSAESLGISQASVSSQLKALEEQLGTRLFDRKPGLRPLLTGDGQAFLDDLRAFDRAAEALAAHRRKVADIDSQPLRLRLLAGQGMFDGYVRPKLDGFFARYPLIELDIETVPPSSSVLRAIRSGRYDFALFNLRSDTAIAPDLVRLAMVRGGIYGHREFARGHSLPLTPDQINLLPFVLPQVGSRQERELLQSLDRFDIRPRRVVGHSQYYDVMAAMLERRVAVSSFSEAILPKSMRGEVIQLTPTDDWNLLLYRRQTAPDPRRDLVERFLIDSLLGDPDFPALDVFDPHWRAVKNG
ncbi:MAG: LysR family transcriptional regulator [Erythrobacter sp.]|nr:LysR family transcriptional regulator [Erythrobacter sp.]